MRVVSYSRGGVPSYGVVVGDGIVDAASRVSYGSVREVLAAGALDALRPLEEKDPDCPLDEVELELPVPDPSKIMCIGINYGDRDAEYTDGAAGRDYPGVFTRALESLVPHGAPILRPPESEQLDYEGEIVVIMGRGGRRIPQAEAESHIAGLSIMNEGTVRDWTRHSRFNVTQGKNFTASGSFGPWMVTADVMGGFDALSLTTRVNGEVRQQDTTANLRMSFAELIAYVSTFWTLHPGDVLATGTPVGSGARFDPPHWLVPGDVVEVEVSGVGVLRNHVEDEVL